MATVRPGMLSRSEPNHTRPCVIERLDIHPVAENPYRVLASSDAAGRVATELDDAEVVLCVGMGIGGPENLPIIEPLARVLGAAIGATRRVVDQGWLHAPETGLPVHVAEDPLSAVAEGYYARANGVSATSRS